MIEHPGFARFSVQPLADRHRVGFRVSAEVFNEGYYL